MTTIIELDNATYLEKAPIYWQPLLPEEHLAALVGYNLGDGNITERNGATQASFYAQKLSDVQSICDSINKSGITSKDVSPKFKKGKEEKFDTYQAYLFGDAARELKSLGCHSGPKVESSFFVPNWILSGTDNIKRAFLAALWGAEGTTPALNVKKSGEEMKLPRMLVLNMSKRSGVDGSAFFAGLKKLMSDLGVETTVSSSTVGRNTTYRIYVSHNIENYLSFFNNIGFLFCENKSFNSWLWQHYLNAYKFEREKVYKDICDLRSKGMSWDKIAEALSITKGKAYALYKRGVNRSSWDFPGFRDWINNRWDAKRGVLKLKIISKQSTGIKQVFNLRVNSHDHSYLVSSGLNNFNSFETMSGRVYYAFDRNVHVGDYAFDPTNYIIVGQDFNVDPMSSVIMQYKKETGELWCIDEIVLRQSNTQEVVNEIERRYFRLFPNRVALFPDPAGGNRSSARGESDLQIFREKGMNRILYHKKHPPVADRINAVNSMLRAADGTIRLRIDKKCKNLIDSLEQVIYKPNSREIDKSQNNEHITDALGYPIEYMFPVRKINLIGVSR